MASYTAKLIWALGDDEDFARGRYGRGHTLAFDGGVTVPASASPHVVGKWADAAAVDPEELLVAALSSCHMLSFLHVARDAGFVVTQYRDHAEGVMEAIAPGKQAITQVVLHPEIEWNGSEPDGPTLERLHHEAHEVCFIANSVRTTVTVASAEQAAITRIDRQKSWMDDQPWAFSLAEAQSNLPDNPEVPRGVPLLVRPATRHHEGRALRTARARHARLAQAGRAIHRGGRQRHLRQRGTDAPVRGR